MNGIIPDPPVGSCGHGPKWICLKMLYPFHHCFPSLDCHHLVPHSPIPLQRRPRWLMLCMTAALFFYQTFDAMDGKQVPSPVIKKCQNWMLGTQLSALDSNLILDESEIVCRFGYVGSHHEKAGELRISVCESMFNLCFGG